MDYFYEEIDLFCRPVPSAPALLAFSCFLRADSNSRRQVAGGRTHDEGGRMQGTGHRRQEARRQEATIALTAQQTLPAGFANCAVQGASFATLAIPRLQALSDGPVYCVVGTKGTSHQW